MAMQQMLLGAGGAGDTTVGIDDVFKTYVYTGSNEARDITTNVDMSDGGMVWIKQRDDAARTHSLWDTERGVNKYLQTQTDAQEQNTLNASYGLKAFNNNGFTLGLNDSSYINANDTKIVSWSFKKQEKFFDIVTWTGNGVQGREIPHNLGSVPGFIAVKRLDGVEDWTVYHRGIGASKHADLNNHWAFTSDNKWDSTEPTASVFTVGSHERVNYDTWTYVAYLWAHEEEAFGPDSDQKISSCGSYTGNGGTQSINCGFEPQFLLIKGGTVADHWLQIDTMRGISASDEDAMIRIDANSNGAEYGFASLVHITSKGFKLDATSDSQVNSSGQTYIYIAIAAETGKTINPDNITAGSDVFAIDTGGSSSTIPDFDSGFPVDFATMRAPASTENWYSSARQIGLEYLIFDGTQAETALTNFTFDSNVGWSKNNNDSAWQSWMWKRHKGFDVVTPTTTGSGYQFISHNLGVAPEMAFMKKRDGTSDWHVWHKDLNGGTTPYNWSLHLNDTSAEWESGGNMWGLSNNPDATWVIIIDSYFGGAGDYLLLLFASVKGISHVGSYDGSDSSQTITIPNGGFRPRFIIIKRIDDAASWYVLDTTRGWASGDDKFIKLDTDNAQSTYDFGAPEDTGFTLTGASSGFNAAGCKYIYYAHA